METNKIIAKLIKKADGNGRMPSIKEIHELLDSFGLKHSFRTSMNIVEYRSGSNRYVNSRHDGKEGYKLDFLNSHMDTSDSYYSWNSTTYAREILANLNILGKIDFKDYSGYASNNI